jgi:hypothetical protein
VVDPIDAIIQMRDALEQIGIPYYVGGSIASLVHGVPRSTMDVDMVADLQSHHIAPLTEALRSNFYADENMMQDALQRRSSFNVIHYSSGFKVDVFIPKGRPFDRIQFERRVERVLDENPAHHVYLASPEDIVLAKIEWYKMGNQVSERQWTDIMGVIKTRGQELDQSYLRQWAGELGISDLLERALREAE